MLGEAFKIMTKTFHRLSVALAATLLLSLAAAAPHAVAAEQGAAVIAVLDVPQIQRNSKAAKSIQTQIEAQRDAYEAELAKQEKSLRAADQQLKAQQASLSPEDYQKKRQELEGQADKLRKNVQARKNQLEKAVNAGADQVRQALIKVVSEIAKAKGLTLVLNKNQVVWSGTTLDITADTLKTLDERLPKVTLPKS